MLLREWSRQVGGDPSGNENELQALRQIAIARGHSSVANWNETKTLRAIAYTYGPRPTANWNDLKTLRSIVSALNAVPENRTVGNLNEIDCLRAIVGFYASGGWELIVGEEGTSFLLRAEDEGYIFKARHYYTNSQGTIFVDSPATGVIGPAAPPVISFVDTFIRADADPMSTTASGGGTWTSGPGAMANCKILSNALRGATGADNATVVATPAFPDDQSAEVTLFGSGADLLNGGPMIRMQSGNASCYLALAESATVAKIYRIDDTGTLAYVLLGAGFTIAAMASGDVLKLAAVGTTLELFHNDVSQGTRTDATYATGQPATWTFGFGAIISLFTATEE